MVRKIIQQDTEGAVTVVESLKSRETSTMKVERKTNFKETAQSTVKAQDKKKQPEEDFFSKSNNVKDKLNKKSD